LLSPILLGIVLAHRRGYTKDITKTGAIPWIAGSDDLADLLEAGASNRAVTAPIILCTRLLTSDYLS